MADIKIVAGRIMDLFYQDYRSSFDFFDDADFVFHTGAAYADMLAMEFDKARAESGSSVVDFSSELLLSVNIETEKDKAGFFARLPQPVMSFPYDSRNSGIQNIFPVGERSSEYIRATISQNWYDEFLPKSNKIFFNLVGNRINLFSNLRNPPEISNIIYVPGISDTLNITDARVSAIIKSTILLLREAARGFVIKETNDGNLNKIASEESDINLNKR